MNIRSLRGSPLQCGEQYGEAFRTELYGFYAQEISPAPALSRQCQRHVEELAPDAAAFIAGISRGAMMPINRVYELTLHEELVHTEHCTALGRPGLIGQNWDWSPALYPWPGVLRLSMPGSPETVTYHYPGLWACCGINSAGLALMWTGGGYYPSLAPQAGLPTYVITAEILARPTVQDALEFVQRVPRAGTFLFFIADATGDLAVVEATPNTVAVERGERLMRANHFELDAIVRCSRQSLPSDDVCNTRLRAAEIRRLADGEDALDADAMKRILTTPPLVHRFGPNSMTVDSLIGDIDNRALLIARGGPQPGPWTAYAL